jgi:hypothetical protein
MRKTLGAARVLLVLCGTLAVIACETAKAEPVLPEYYPAGRTLVGDPTQNGLLMVDASLSLPMRHLPLNVVAISEAATPNETVLAGAHYVRLFPPKFSGAVVFANLRPGRYSIRRLRFSSGHETAWYEPPPETDLSIEVRAGEVSYLGKILVTQRFLPALLRFEIVEDRPRELEAWRQVLEKFGITPWTPLIEARVNALQ